MAERKVRLIDVDTLWRIERIGAVSLSPDGAQAVCSVTSHSMEENKGSTSLWLLSTFGGVPRRLTACGEKDGQAAWSPKGGAIAFVSKREQEGHKDDTAQLYLISPDGGEARRITDFAPGIEAFKWFAEQKVELAVVETGLGGRLDSTNVIKPEVTAITSISKDHMAQLGGTIAKIAEEKAEQECAYECRESRTEDFLERHGLAPVRRR